MQIKFLDLKAQYDSIKPEIDAAIMEVINNTAFALGPAVRRFEENFAAYCGADYCIGVNSGTTALHLILKALGIAKGDEVITAANTFIATAAAIMYTGAKPVLVDIDPKTRNIDLNLIAKAITSNTKAIIPVHLYGSMVDMEGLNKIVPDNIPIIEDAAQAQGAKLNDKPAGSFGLAAAFSFYPGKNLGAYGEAGAVVTSDKNLDRIIRKLRDHGSEKKYHHDIIGYNARMDGIQGAVLDVKLKYLEDWNRARNRISDLYTELLEGLPVNLPGKFPGHYDVYHQYVIETDRRDELIDFLQENGVPVLIHYPIPIHKQYAYIDSGFTSGPLPVTEKLAGRILSLPIYPELEESHIEYIAEKIKEFFK